MILRLAIAIFFLLTTSAATAQGRFLLDWDAIGEESIRHLVELIRIDSRNPPGGETAVANYLQAALAAEGVKSKLIALDPDRANLIARMAHGMADDVVTATLLATRAPVVVAPAMNTAMLEHAAVRANIARLREYGHRIVGMFLQRLGNQPATGLCFLRSAAAEKRMHQAIASTGQRLDTDALGIRNRPTHRIVIVREQGREHGVEPVYEKLARAEISAQQQGLQVFPADADLLREQKLADLCIAKPINRLHWIANAKQSSAIALAPPSR